MTELTGRTVDRTVDRTGAVLVLGLGALHTAIAIAMGSMNLNGVAYLDVGEAWWTGDWPRAVNAVWSPLYPLLIGPAALDFVPVAWRLPIIQVTNFLLFILAYVAFRYMWSALRTVGPTLAAPETDTVPISRVYWSVIGHALFGFVALNLIEIWSVTPDMLLAAVLFGALAVMLRACDRPAPRTAAGFGVLIGLAYLCKAEFFLLGPVLIAIAGTAWAKVPASHDRSRRARFSPGLLAAAGFLVVALAWASTVSVRRGEPTWGEAGRITYLRLVNDVSFPFWEDPGSAGGEPIHAARKQSERPAIWGFGDPAVGGTYPPGFDPAYWYDGVVARPDPRRQAEELAGNAVFTFELVARRLGLSLGALLVLLLLTRAPVGARGARARQAASRSAGPAATIAIGLAGIAWYMPVLVEARYIAPFVALVFGGALSLVRIPEERGGRLVTRAASLVMAGGLLLEIVGFNLAGAARVADFDLEPRADIGFGEPAPYGPVTAAPGTDSGRESLTFTGSRHVAVARALNERGIGPGSRIAVIGDPSESFWARLGGMSVVAELSDDFELYWGADEARRQELDAAFAATGATVIVAEVRPNVVPAAWELLGGEADPAILRLGPPAGP